MARVWRRSTTTGTPLVLLVAALVLGRILNLSGCTAISIRVQFDGSLRTPSDPGYPTSSLARMAACAASLSIVQSTMADGSLFLDIEGSTPLVPRRQPHEAQPVQQVMLGGKLLTASSLTTSGEVEYEGLLFALEGLTEVLRNFNSRDAQWQPCDYSIIDVVIQGDCKTVIEQMKGVSQPRKLEDYHRQATSYLSKVIEESTGIMVKSAVTTLPSPHLDVQFQHIPRSENSACDRLSACVLAHQQASTYQSLHRELNDLARGVSEETMDRSGGTNDNRTRYATRLDNVLTDHFSDGTSVVPLSTRPLLYRSMARIASALSEYTTLLNIGQMYQTDVDVVLRKSRSSKAAVVISSLAKLGDDDNNDCAKESADPSSLPHLNSAEAPVQERHLAEATTYQIVALEALRRPKEAKQLAERKHRYVLDKFRRVTEQVRSNLASMTAMEVNDGTSTTNEAMNAMVWLKQQDGVDWPAPVVHWCKEAFVSNSWNETRSYWSTTSNA